MKSIRIYIIAPTIPVALAFTAAAAPDAAAQSADIVSASVTTCAARGSVIITVLGVPTSMPLPCVNESQQNTIGTDEASITGDIDVGVPGMLHVAEVLAPRGRTAFGVAPSKTELDGFTEVESLGLVQNMVNLQGLAGRMICDAVTGDDTVRCEAGIALAGLQINGQLVDLPQDPIPFNYTIPVGGSVQIKVLGIPVTVAMAGTLVLNEVTVRGVGTKRLEIEHSPMHLNAGGSVFVWGLGVVGVQVDVPDNTIIPISARFPIISVLPILVSPKSRGPIL